MRRKAKKKHMQRRHTVLRMSGIREMTRAPGNWPLTHFSPYPTPVAPHSKSEKITVAADFSVSNKNPAPD